MSQQTEENSTVEAKQDATGTANTTEQTKSKKKLFNENLVQQYPRSNKKLKLSVENFGLKNQDNDKSLNGQSVHISPHGIEFRTADEYEEGTLLKIHVSIPDYWARKQKHVNYGRIDQPGDFRILAKVQSSKEVGKRGKKKLVMAETLIIDEVDEQVLKKFLQEG